MDSTNPVDTSAPGAPNPPSTRTLGAPGPSRPPFKPRLQIRCECGCERLVYADETTAVLDTGLVHFSCLERIRERVAL